jgi:excisionase family DNA binding protein
MVATDSEILTLSELAEYLRLAESTVYKLTREGTIPAQKLGKQWRFHKGAIDRWLDTCQNTTV